MSRRSTFFIFEGPFRHGGQSLADERLRPRGKSSAAEVKPTSVTFSKPPATGPSELASSIATDLAPVRREFERKSISCFRSAVRAVRKDGRR
jgi:hypothetical protein